MGCLLQSNEIFWFPNWPARELQLHMIENLNSGQRGPKGTGTIFTDRSNFSKIYSRSVDDCPLFQSTGSLSQMSLLKLPKKGSHTCISTNN